MKTCLVAEYLGKIFVCGILAGFLSGCEPTVNNNLQVNTALATVVHGGGRTLAPLASQPVAGQWVNDMGVNDSNNPNHLSPGGSSYSFSGTTSTVPINLLGFEVLSNGQWPTYFMNNSSRMPAYWNFAWQHPSYCVDQNPPYYPLANPFYTYNQPTIPSLSISVNPQLNFFCYRNSPANPDFDPNNTNPQFVLDTAIPSSIQIATFSSIGAAAADTHLHIYDKALNLLQNVAATSIGSSGASATFPYPSAPGGGILPAGAYITTITTDTAGVPQSTVGMEPIYLAHNDTSYTSAFGVAISHQKMVETSWGAADSYGDGTCAGGSYYNQTSSDTGPMPVVALSSQGKIAVGSSTNTINVGSYPTVVIPYNDLGTGQYDSYGPCDFHSVEISGPQLALVVNTGSNSISLISIGQYGYGNNYLTGNVAVGQSPVSAVVNSDQTKAYVANYADGTVSEIDLVNAQKTRDIYVMTHPTAVSIDNTGKLWVGGQGYLKSVNLSTGTVASSIPVDGTVNGLSFDGPQNALVHSVLQNGNSSSGGYLGTHANVIAYNASSPVSYSTTNLVDISTGASTTSSATVNTIPFAQSSLASSLAYPAQTAFNPPIYSSSDGDIIATSNGINFTVSVISSGKVLVAGTVPYPIRGVALSNDMLYFTMSDSNSLVSLPLKLQ